MGKIYYCVNCINNNKIITLTEWRKWGTTMELPYNKEAIVNGFIDFPTNTTDFTKCPHCDSETVELSLTVDDWNILKQISTESDFILQMDNLKKTDVIDFNLKLSQLKANTTTSTPSVTPTPSQSNIPKCPTCGSTNIKKISGTKKWVSTGLFGLASSDLGKTMQCNSCGAKW